MQTSPCPSCGREKAVVLQRCQDCMTETEIYQTIRDYIKTHRFPTPMHIARETGISIDKITALIRQGAFIQIPNMHKSEKNG